VSASHTIRLQSRPPLTRYFPSELRASASTSSVCPVSAGADMVMEWDDVPLLFLLLGALCRSVSLLPVGRCHFMMEPSFPEV